MIVSVDRHLTEVQVRTELQHRWAMLVESFASAWGQRDEPVRLRQHVGGDLFVSGDDARLRVVRWLAILERVSL